MTDQNITLRVALDPKEAEHVIVRFLKDYFAGAKRSKAVVGLSGGLDSAVVAALCARALGPANVLTIVLPTSGTPPADLEDAASVVKTFGVRTQTLSIQGMVDAAGKAMPGMDRVALGNAAARLRMVALHDVAHRETGLVVGTGNKSEILTGYFSKFGDGGVDLQPIGDLYKTQVRILAEHLKVPERVRKKPPTAGLWHGQTDEGELGITYEQLDRILLGLEVRLPTDLIAATVGVPESEVERINMLRESTQHKRRPPLAPKFGLRTPGIDWRTYTVH